MPRTKRHAIRPTENQKQCPSTFLRKGGGQLMGPTVGQAIHKPLYIHLHDIWTLHHQNYKYQQQKWLIELRFYGLVNPLGSCWASQFTYPVTFLGSLTSTCAHSLARNWQLSYLNQQKGDYDHRKYFMINLYVRMLRDPAAIEMAISWSPVSRASKWAT